MANDTQYERETTIVYVEADGEAMVWSVSAVFQRKMAKAGVTPYRVAEREKGAKACWYKVPKTWIRVRPPIRKQLTEEQRAILAERGRSTLQRRLLAKTRQQNRPDDQKTHVWEVLSE